MNDRDGSERETNPLRWCEEMLECPRDRTSLESRGDRLECKNGHSYPVVDGIPVMLLPESPHTLWVAAATVAATAKPRASRSGPFDAYYLDTLGISAEQRETAQRLIEDGSPIDPVVAVIIGATNGNLYKSLVGSLDRYPIPKLRLPDSDGALLLDIGCNWGRWSVAAHHKGYRVVGIDPSLGALLAAQRVARSFGAPARFVCGDARHMPFQAKLFDTAFSYSVLQHFSYEDAREALRAVQRVVRKDGTVLVQMPNGAGVRSLYNQARRRFRAPRDFEVRYWTTRGLERSFSQIIGDSQLEVDCFFGLGLQASDRELMSRPAAALIDLSEALRALSARTPVLTHAADSVYLRSTVR